MVPAGRLNTLVEIQQITQEQDDVLNLKQKWGEYAKAWCGFLADPGNESVANQQTIASVTWRLETHWTAKLALMTTKMRMKLRDGRVLPIRSIVNDKMQNRKLIITCEETN